MLSNSITKELALCGMTASELAQKVKVPENLILDISEKSIVPNLVLAMSISKVLNKDTQEVFILTEKGIKMAEEVIL